MLILPSTGLTNPSNSHFTNPKPQFSSIIGPVVGYNGSTTSDLALQKKGIYKYSLKKPLHGGKNKKSNRKYIGMKSNTRKKVRHGGSYGISNIKPTSGQGSIIGPSAGYADIKQTKEIVTNPMAMRNKTQLGGRKSRGRSNKKISNKKRSNKKKSSSKRSNKKNSNKKKSCKRGGGVFNGYVALSPSYSIDVKSKLLPNQSALASPPPIKIENNCLNTWKHLGSEKLPYNKVWN